ncbi:MAG: lysine transporter LysE [Flavobacteriaceae bacterium]|nr:MAG: lysine transporter LysE [Flavobacteriaceae bacterium]
MSLIDIKDAVLIGFFLSFMIGPVFFTLIQTSILKGARAAIAFDLGVVLGDIAFILIAYYGSRSLLEKIKDDPRLFFIGGLILVVYGLITYLSKKDKNTKEKAINVPEKSNYFRLVLKGFLLNFINIGVLAFWLGMILVIGPELDMNSGRIFNYFAVILFSYFLTDLGKILLAKQLKKRLTPKVISKIQRTMGIILIIFGVVLILKGFLPKYKLDINHVIEQVE